MSKWGSARDRPLVAQSLGKGEQRLCKSGAIVKRENLFHIPEQQCSWSITIGEALLLSTAHFYAPQ